MLLGELQELLAPQEQLEKTGTEAEAQEDAKIAGETDRAAMNKAMRKAKKNAAQREKRAVKATTAKAAAEKKAEE